MLNRTPYRGFKLIVVSFPSATDIGEGLARGFETSHYVVRRKVFPDGESYVRIEAPVDGEEVMLVQKTYPCQDKRLVELLIAVDALVSRGASRVIAVLPYLAYARQDREFLEGEGVSVRTVLRALRSAGVDGLYVVDVHKVDSLRFFGGPAKNLIAANTWAKALSREDIKAPLVVAPDVGASSRAKALSEKLGCDYLIIKKVRDRVTGEIRHKLPTDLRLTDKDVIVVDDIISTGGTISNVARYVRERGARSVFVVASHGLFVGRARNRVREAGVDKVIVLNTTALKVVDPLIRYEDVSAELSQFISNNPL